MNLVELDHALRKLRLSGMAAVLETRLRHAQTEKLTSGQLERVQQARGLRLILDVGSAAPLYAVLSVGPGWDWTTLSGMYPDVTAFAKVAKSGVTP